MVESVRRPVFRKGDTFVATQRITLVEGQYIEPGELIPKSIRRASIMRWFARRMIAPMGQPWTEVLLRRRLHRLEEDEKAKRLHPAGAEEIVRVKAALLGKAELSALGKSIDAEATLIAEREARAQAGKAARAPGHAPQGAPTAPSAPQGATEGAQGQDSAGAAPGAAGAPTEPQGGQAELEEESRGGSPSQPKSGRAARSGRRRAEAPPGLPLTEGGDGDSDAEQQQAG